MTDPWFAHGSVMVMVRVKNVRGFPKKIEKNKVSTIKNFSSIELMRYLNRCHFVNGTANYSLSRLIHTKERQILHGNGKFYGWTAIAVASEIDKVAPFRL
ncbi:hypothetical protein BpHYR1_022270 [Brachionus plicatilis]|uniref:Uncharacterized protein n=1 Tax=Brachionus plicatilis TaxID=10195 RepID=A0A3M7RFB8_BRAPC|nr:hypothetical protein BpHYR1_022270 [Brachionus plicatilis]